MNFITTLEGEELILKSITKKDLNLHLFSNDITPSKINNNVQELDHPDYEIKILNNDDWIYENLQEYNIYVAKNEIQEWVFRSNANVYGYYITDKENTKTYFIHRFDNAPYQYDALGGNLEITPILSVK